MYWNLWNLLHARLPWLKPPSNSPPTGAALGAALNTTAKRTERRAQLGRSSEQLALRYLQSQGYLIEQTNVRFPVGEIDIIAWEGHTLCFVEVRSVSSSAWGGALASVTDRKRHHLIRAAQWYLLRLRTLPSETRFDVVGVEWTTSARPTLELVKGAFLAS